MEYIRITSIEDRWFPGMYQLMQQVFPANEVLAFEKWAEPLQDPGLRVYVVVHEDQVVGATEYRYLPSLRVAMTDFTIIGRPGLALGKFMWEQREADLLSWAAEQGQEPLGMFAEVFDPSKVPDFQFGGLPTMHPWVRREVLSHMGYKRLDFAYVHPSWEEDGEAVTGLDLCFLPWQGQEALPAALVADFLTTYYAVLPNKPASWQQMVDELKLSMTISLLPL